MNLLRWIGVTGGRLLTFSPNPALAAAGLIVSDVAVLTPQKGKTMNVLQLVEQTVELGVALEGTVAAVEAQLTAGQSVQSPAIKIVIGGHTYSASVSFSKIS